MPAFIALAVLCGCGRPSLPANYEAVLREIAAVEFQIGWLTPDHGGKTLAYVHATGAGRSLALLDLKTLARQPIPLTNEVIQVSGWSPDDRYLAFVESPTPRPGEESKLRASWVTLYQRESGQARRISGREGVAENYFFWLSPETYFFASRGVTAPLAELFLGSVADGPGKKVSNFMPELVVM